jgi:hypothetical protein
MGRKTDSNRAPLPHERFAEEARPILLLCPHGWGSRFMKWPAPLLCRARLAEVPVQLEN